MNLGIRGIGGDLAPERGDGFHRDLHKDLEVDYEIANPPFNMRDCHDTVLDSDSDACWLIQGRQAYKRQPTAKEVLA